ncbi:MAG TPA: hypothetical protein VLK33_16450 [Terriglobales bacterium]|nr:hypothetical protein [Terriglobales bacterium]
MERDHQYSDDAANQSHNFEYFWLCPICSNFLTVVYEEAVVKVQPLHHLLPPNSVRLKTVETRRSH